MKRLGLTYRLCWIRLCLCLVLCGVGWCTARSDAQETTSVDTLTSVGASHRDRRPVVTLQGDSAVVPPVKVVTAAGDTVAFASIDSVDTLTGVEILTDTLTQRSALGKVRAFNPDPQRALWLSALCPGLGQIYNRRYWKLPIVVGAFVGLTYGTAWNNRMYQDYSKAYRDVMDDDPDTNSYMDFFAPTVSESDLDKAWLQKTMRNKRDYYRRYKEICLMAMVAVYFINIVDAYVDASLAHFDISPDLSMDVAPAAVIEPHVSRAPSWGLQCAITF